MKNSNKETGGSIRPIRVIAMGEVPELGQTLYKDLDRFPEEAQEFVTGLSSWFLEPDMHRSYRENPEKVESIATELRGFGVGEGDIQTVMDFFSFPFTPLEK